MRVDKFDSQIFTLHALVVAAAKKLLNYVKQDFASNGIIIVRTYYVRLLHTFLLFNQWSHAELATPGWMNCRFQECTICVRNAYPCIQSCLLRKLSVTFKLSRQKACQNTAFSSRCGSAEPSPSSAWYFEQLIKITSVAKRTTNELCHCDMSSSHRVVSSRRASHPSTGVRT